MGVRVTQAYGPRLLSAWFEALTPLPCLVTREVNSRYCLQGTNHGRVIEIAHS
jgi:hypothetical protein